MERERQIERERDLREREEVMRVTRTKHMESLDTLQRNIEGLLPEINQMLLAAHRHGTNGNSGAGGHGPSPKRQQHHRGASVHHSSTTSSGHSDSKRNGHNSNGSSGNDVPVMGESVVMLSLRKMMAEMLLGEIDMKLKIISQAKIIHRLRYPM
jgi:hypothetical protein